MDDKFPSLEEEMAAADKARTDRMHRWRRVFGNDDGKQVLIDILSVLHCLETVVPTPEVIIRQNVGHWMLAELGIMQSGQEEALVDAYLSIPPRLSKAADIFMRPSASKE